MNWLWLVSCVLWLASSALKFCIKNYSLAIINLITAILCFICFLII